MKKNLALQLLLLVLLSTLLVGCGSKVSKENFDKIKPGMTVSEVESILGKGNEQSSGTAALGGNSAKTITWADGSKTITINFLNDKVVTTSQSGL